MFRETFRSILGVVLFLAVLFTTTGCVPAKVRFAPGVIPEIDAPSHGELRTGHSAKMQILRGATLNNASVYTRRVTRVLNRLFAVTPATGHWRVFIINSPQWNAMTTPGNYIYVFSGLLDDLQDDGELAAVLAHEIGHRLAVHHEMSAGEIFGKVLVAATGAGLAIAMSEEEDIEPDDIETVVGLATTLGKGFVVNPYSQVKEHEADQIGLFLMADAGYKPSKAARVWQNKSLESAEMPEFFRTHPRSENRHKRLMTFMELAERRYSKRGKRKAVRKKNSPRIGSSTFSVNRHN